jgi:hypothetical protein
VSNPWTFVEARQACRKASRQQEAAEESFQEATVDAAKGEEQYRLALAEEIIRQHDSGVAWTVAPDLARGNEKVAGLRRERDIAVGVRDALDQACWRRNADRKDAQRFADWSMRRELAEGYDDTPTEHRRDQ